MASEYIEESIRRTNTSLKKQVQSLQSSHMSIKAENRQLKRKLAAIENGSQLLISKELYQSIQGMVGKFLRCTEDKS